jgi:hypothetical protein
VKPLTLEKIQTEYLHTLTNKRKSKLDARQLCIERFESLKYTILVHVCACTLRNPSQAPKITISNN